MLRSYAVCVRVCETKLSLWIQIVMFVLLKARVCVWVFMNGMTNGAYEFVPWFTEFGSLNSSLQAWFFDFDLLRQSH